MLTSPAMVTRNWVLNKEWSLQRRDHDEKKSIASVSIDSPAGEEYPGQAGSQDLGFQYGTPGQFTGQWDAT